MASQWKPDLQPVQAVASLDMVCLFAIVSLDNIQQQ
jgi:hypothetical protein